MATPLLSYNISLAEILINAVDRHGIDATQVHVDRQAGRLFEPDVRSARNAVHHVLDLPSDRDEPVEVVAEHLTASSERTPEISSLKRSSMGCLTQAA